MANRKINVLFAAFECTPFIKTGGLGDVAGSLPAALKCSICDVRVILPKLRQIPQEYHDQMEFVTSFGVPLSWRVQHCGIFKLKKDNIQYYFLDNEWYFARDNAYGYGDDCERVAYFSKAVLEALQYLDFAPDVIHANDWHTALIPVFLREQYRGLPLYERIKTVFTIHNLKFQGICGDYLFGDVLGLSGCKNAWDQLRWGRDAINFMQGALYYSDFITTVSPTYAEEICTYVYGEGLDPVLANRRDRLQGILNGIDRAKFDPADAPTPFSGADLSGKAQCKAALQAELGLPVRDDAPLAVLISRLTDQKGLDLLASCIHWVLNENVQIAILGTGEYRYEHLFGDMAWHRPDCLSVRFAFDEPLSQRMYAGADMLLMPSLFEPCGLNQMIAMRYGTLPVVRETGGLRDSVVPYNKFTGEGTGFSFMHASGQELGDTILSAARVFWDDRKAWTRLQKQAMRQDFSWKNSAKEYRAIYRNLLQ